MRLTGSFHPTVCHGLSSAATSLPTGALCVSSTGIDIRTDMASMVACLGSPFMTGTSTALLTDHYELTMVAAALTDGAACGLRRAPAAPPGGPRGGRCVSAPCARRRPNGRRYGIGGGTARVVEAISR